MMLIIALTIGIAGLFVGWMLHKAGAILEQQEARARDKADEW